MVVATLDERAERCAQREAGHPRAVREPRPCPCLVDDGLAYVEDDRTDWLSGGAHKDCLVASPGVASGASREVRRLDARSVAMALLVARARALRAGASAHLAAVVGLV